MFGRKPRFTIDEVTNLIDALTHRDEEVRKGVMNSEGMLALPPELDDDQRERLDRMCHDVSDGALDALHDDAQDPEVAKWRKGAGTRGIDKD